MDKSVEGGRRTAAALETLQAEIIDKMTDIDETWEEIEANSEGIYDNTIIYVTCDKK